MEWEQIDSCHQRCKVLGGWLVKAYESVAHILPQGDCMDGWDWRVSMCFVPDPNHEWKINNVE